MENKSKLEKEIFRGWNFIEKSETKIEYEKLKEKYNSKKENYLPMSQIWIG